MRETVAAWLGQNEQRIVPAWIRAVRSQGSDRDRQLTTRELERKFFADFYAAFVVAVREDNPERMAEVTDRIAGTRVGEGYKLEDTLDIFFMLKDLIWDRLAQAHTTEAALSRMHLIEPTFQGCLRLLGRAFTWASSSLLAERLVEAEFTTRRLTVATEEADRALSRLRIMYNVSRAMSTTLDLQQVVAAVAENLASVSQIDRCGIWLADRDGLELSVAASEGIEAEKLEGAYLPAEGARSVITRAFGTRKLQVLSYAEAGNEDLATLFPQRTLAVVPLQAGEQLFGVISVDRLALNRPLETAVVEVIQSVADQTAVALRNIQLYEELVELNQGLEQRVQERTEELARLNLALAQLDRKKSDFVAIAAHELKTPLTLVQGYTEMIAEGGILHLPSATLERLVGGILNGTNRLRTIVENIIDVALIDTEVLALTLEPVSLPAVIGAVCDEMAEAVGERSQSLEVGDLSGLPYIEADAVRLRQLLGNILGNAVKYTPDRGCIRLSAQHWQARQSRPAFVELVVSDSGVGIDVDEQERIFDKFYRVEGPELHSSSKTRFMGAGPGLGLAIAKGIVDAHGGRIWVESPGHDPERCPGSQFHVLLPVRSAWEHLQATREI
jgi:signal transduction histidine kinase